MSSYVTPESEIANCHSVQDSDLNPTRHSGPHSESDSHFKRSSAGVEELSLYNLRIPVESSIEVDSTTDGIISTPVLQPTPSTTGPSDDLSPAQAKAILEFLLLSGDRLTQMTRTYHDLNAVTHLLEEKERDLELAARIGQELLVRNHALTERVDQLESQINAKNDMLVQYQHEVGLKNSLLRIYAAEPDLDELSAHSDAETSFCPDYGPDASLTMSPRTPANDKAIALLERKIDVLQTENENLRHQTDEITSLAEKEEAHEGQLMQDTAEHLREAEQLIDELSDQLAAKRDGEHRVKEETTLLLAKICDLQTQLKAITAERQELADCIQVYRAAHEELQASYDDLRLQFEDTVIRLEDVKDELANAETAMCSGQRRQLPSAHQSKIPEYSLRHELDMCPLFSPSEFKMMSSVAHSRNELTTEADSLKFSHTLSRDADCDAGSVDVQSLAGITDAIFDDDEDDLVAKGGLIERTPEPIDRCSTRAMSGDLSGVVFERLPYDDRSSIAASSVNRSLSPMRKLDTRACGDGMSADEGDCCDDLFRATDSRSHSEDRWFSGKHAGRYITIDQDENGNHLMNLEGKNMSDESICSSRHRTSVGSTGNNKKVRIVKPIEGSLTLSEWRRLVCRQMDLSCLIAKDNERDLSDAFLVPPKEEVCKSNRTASKRGVLTRQFIATDAQLSIPRANSRVDQILGCDTLRNWDWKTRRDRGGTSERKVGNSLQQIGTTSYAGKVDEPTSPYQRLSDNTAGIRRHYGHTTSRLCRGRCCAPSMTLDIPSPISPALTPLNTPIRSRDSSPISSHEVTPIKMSPDVKGEQAVGKELPDESNGHSFFTSVMDRLQSSLLGMTRFQGHPRQVIGSKPLGLLERVDELGAIETLVDKCDTYAEVPVCYANIFASKTTLSAAGSQRVVSSDTLLSSSSRKGGMSL